MAGQGTMFLAEFPKWTSLFGKALRFCQRMGRAGIYRVVSAFFSQNKLILFSSSKEDKFGNISALANRLQKERIPFLRISQEQLKSHPFRSHVLLARACVLVIDGSSPAARMKLHRNTCLIHCWHAGGAYKKVAFDAKRKNNDDANEEKRIERIHCGISWFVCTSEETARIYANAFRLPLKRMLVFGSPRLDVVLKSAAVTPDPEVYTILYAPTYRTQTRHTRYIPPLPDAKALHAALASRLGENVRLAFRGHPTAPVPDDLMGWEDWSNIPQHEALRRASVLMTDYSSIFFDFLPLKRPVVFYVPDFDSYQRHERELYFSPYDAFPKTTCSDEQDLILLLEHCRYMTVDYREIWRKYMSACDGKSSERLCAFIQKMMKRNTQ